MRCLIFICIFFLFGNLFSQTTLVGKVNDKDNKPISLANILLVEHYTKNIVATTETKENGLFVIQKKIKTGVYTIEITRLGFSKFKQTIVVDDNSESKIELEFTLENSDLFKLKEVTIKNKPPVIIKKDTIIYDVEQHTEAYDQTLEQVLARLDGFKIESNGDIKVNGKIINKVLIDGKEVSDFGNSILTKSLSPEDVEDIEVRFDEKNKKLKESLLSDEKFAVLDIKLDSKLNKDFFGKQQLSGGYQDNIKAGAYGNFFSLNDSFNLQFFGESTNFGNNFIDLKQIKNIGEEAIQQMFSLPKNFNEVKQRQGLQDELYGFKNFIQNDNSVFGFSMNIVLSKNTDLYIGSFNNYAFMKNQNNTEQFFQNELQNDLQINNKSRDYQSKNKLQLKHTTDNLKIKTDLNYVWFDNQINNFALSDIKRSFDRTNKTNNFYFNNSIEYKFTKKLGAIMKTSYKTDNYDVATLFETDDNDIASFIGQSINDEVFFFNQQNKNEEKQFVQVLKFNYKTNWGNHFLGYRFQNNSLETTMKTDIEDDNFDFNSPRQNLRYRLHNGIYTYQNSFDKLSVFTSLMISQIRFPYGANDKKDYFFQYNTKLNYDFNQNSNLNLMASETLGNFPLNKIIGGSFFSDFQTVFQPNQLLEPFINKTYTLSFFKNVKKHNLQIDAAILNGISDNLNNQLFSSKLILEQANQLRSKYTAFSSTFKKKYNRTEIILEPEILNNSFQFIFNDELQKNKSQRYLLGLKINTPIFKYLDTNILLKYSQFEFTNTTTDFKNNFTFLTNRIALKSKFLDEKLLIAILYKNVFFTQSNTHYNHLDFALRKKTKNNWSFFISLSNILNANVFETRDFNQSVFTISRNKIFERYINLGVEYKFK